MLKEKLNEVKNENKAINKGLILMKETITRNSSFKVRQSKKVNLRFDKSDAQDKKSANSIGSPMNSQLFNFDFDV